MSDLTSSELRDLTLSVGTHRSDRRLSPLEVALLIDKMVQSGSSRRECAQLLGIGSTQVSSFLKLLSLDVRVQHLADWSGTRNASIPFSTLSELARLDANEQVRVGQAILRHDLTWKEVVQIVQVRKRSKERIDTCIDGVLALRPKLETHYIFVGVITSDVARDCLGLTSQADRDAMIAKILDQLLGSHYSVKSRLGLDSFTILSDHDLPKLLDLTPDELEAAINSRLKTLRPS